MRWWRAVREGDPRVLLYLYVGAFRDLRNPHGLSNLQVACEAGQPVMVSAFLRAGYNANEMFPMSPLMYAAATGRCDVVRILLSANARIPAAWNLNTVPYAVRSMLRTCRVVRKWRRWSHRRRRSRERQWAFIVLREKHLSCDKQWFLSFV